MDLTRLRLARRPPCTIPVSTAFPITLTLSDDLGTALYLPSLSIRVQVIDPSTSAPSTSYTVIPSTLELSSDKGDFHSFSLAIQPLSAAKPRNTAIELRFTPVGEETPDEETSQLAHFLNEPTPGIISYNDSSYCILSVRVSCALTPRSSATSTEKVQRTLCTFNTPKPLHLVEQPDLSLGAHIWDCALILSYRLATSLSSSADVVVDLGAGCGLVGGLLASRMNKGSVWLTDTEQVVEDSTKVNLGLLRQSVGKGVVSNSKVLDWESEDDLSGFGSKEKTCLLVASDVLYNISSHQIFLKTILRFFEHFNNAKALIAYKPRMEGDDAFFTMARQSDLLVEERTECRWGQIQIWSIEKA